MTRKTGIVVSDSNQSSLRDELDDRINEFNVRTTGIDDGRLLWATVRSEDGTLLAGIYGHTWGGTCEISHLWVREEHRGQGHGQELLKSAEHEATNRHCTQVVLETHSFQAPNFYERMGYRRLGTVPDYPIGHEKAVYAKDLVHP